MEEIYKISVKAAIEGGRRIMKIYNNRCFQVANKEDNSPITIADEEANDIIIDYLLPTNIPIISEENQQWNFEERKNWNKCWLVDPLDGTKEFIKRNGEFTVNIALIEDNKPVFGVIFVPAVNELYFGDVLNKKSYKGIINDGKFKFELSNFKQIMPSFNANEIRVVGSRSHMNRETLNYIEKLRRDHKKEVRIVSKGSSLKFCLVAEGKADVYPRFAPTMEWDTAAGHAICNAVGLDVIDLGTFKSMRYNREILLNNCFLVSNIG